MNSGSWCCRRRAGFRDSEILPCHRFLKDSSDTGAPECLAYLKEAIAIAVTQDGSTICSLWLNIRDVALS
jgi:hypothetical protein